MRNYPKKEDFKKVCIACMNGSRISSCPSKTCMLAPLKDGKRFNGGKKKLFRFCKSCDPEGYRARATCKTVFGCPLEEFHNKLRNTRVIKGLTYVVPPKGIDGIGRPKNVEITKKSSVKTASSEILAIGKGWE